MSVRKMSSAGASYIAGTEYQSPKEGIFESKGILQKRINRSKDKKIFHFLLKFN